MTACVFAVFIKVVK